MKVKKEHLNEMKKQTIQFYTDGGQYKGWIYLNKKNYHNQIKNWLRSGNSIKLTYKGFKLNGLINYTNKHILENLLKQAEKEK